MINKQGKVTAIEYAITGIIRAINSNKNQKIKEIYAQELQDLQDWKAAVIAAKD